MRLNFDEQLDSLNKELTAMGGLCESAIALSAKALTGRDVKIAETVSELAVRIDEEEREIERLCMKLLLQQQPVAKDLRVISSALKMVTDMERIGDNSGDIAEIVRVANFTEKDDTLTIREMSEATIKMVTDSIDAFVKRDASLAESVIQYDDVVDTYFTDIKEKLIDRIKNGDTRGEATLDLLMIAKYFERIGDHAANIASWVIFSVSGTKE